MLRGFPNALESAKKALRTWPGSVSFLRLSKSPYWLLIREPLWGTEWKLIWRVDQPVLQNELGLGVAKSNLKTQPTKLVKKKKKSDIQKSYISPKGDLQDRASFFAVYLRYVRQYSMIGAWKRCVLWRIQVLSAVEWRRKKFGRSSAVLACAILKCWFDWPFMVQLGKDWVISWKEKQCRASRSWQVKSLKSPDFLSHGSKQALCADSWRMWFHRT